MSYNKKIWKNGDLITKEALNNIENGIETAHQNLDESGTSYDDTVIRNDINTLKTDLGTAELTTTAKNVKGAINELSSFIKNPIITTENLINKCVTEEKTSFLSPVNSGNILDSNTFERGKYASGSGNLVNHDSYGRFLQYIELDHSKERVYIARKNKTTGVISEISTTGTDVYFYDQNKGYLTDTKSCSNFKLSDYPNAKYIRFSIAYSTFENNYIGVYYNQVPAAWEDYKIRYAFNDNIILNDNNNNDNDNLNKYVIDCWGDSLTNGVGGNGTNYPTFLKTLLGDVYTVNRYGNGGEKCHGIAARQGGYDIYLKPFTLPATGKVNVEFYDNFDTTIKLTNTWGVNPCYINGVHCKFSIENKIYYIEQVDGTQEYIYSRPIKLNTYGSLNSKNNINIIWSGTNDKASSGSTIDDIINAIDVMVQNLNHKKYIVVGLTSKNYHDDIVEKNKALGRKFGKHFIDIRKYILDYGLEDMGITPTAEDSAAISGGEMPPSLLSDVVHFNSTGYQLIANLIYKKGQDLEYW